MEYIIHYDICALAIYTVVLVIFYMKKSLSDMSSKVFEALLWCSSAAALLDILSVYVNRLDCDMTYKWMLNILFYFAHHATPFLCALYFVLLTEPLRNMKTKRKLHLLVPYSIMCLLITFTPLTGWLFGFDEDGDYGRGPLSIITLLISLYYIAYLVVYVIRRKEMFEHSVRQTIYGLGFVVIIPIIIQFINEELLIESFAGSICLLIIYLKLQNNDELVDNFTKMMTWPTFMNDSKKYIGASTNFSTLVVKISDVAFISETFGIQFTTDVSVAFSQFLNRFVRFGNAYTISNGCYALNFFDDPVEADKVAGEIINRMTQPWLINNMETRLSVSTCHVKYPNNADTYEEFLECIDGFVKSSETKNPVVKLDELNLKDKKRRAEIEKAIIGGLKNNRFEVLYQPIYSVKKQRFVTAEALIRLRDPYLGYILPSEFIPISEKNGTIIKIGEFVLDSVCRFISGNNLETVGIEYIEVNLSVVQCMQADLVSKLTSIIQRFDVDPTKICLEITETAALYAPEIVQYNMQQLCANGITFALDDYGTGYSNLQQILTLPIKYIKFDKSLIMQAFSSDKGRIAVESSMEMAKNMNLEVIAEGIETIEYASKIKQLNCDYYQGFYFSDLIEAENFTERILLLNKLNKEKFNFALSIDKEAEQARQSVIDNKKKM